MNKATFEQKIKALSKFKILNQEDIGKFSDVISNLGDWDLFRLNPITFARTHNLNPESVLDIFIHAVKIGLFDFSWNLICPGCGSVEYSHDNLNSLSKHENFYCVMCNKYIPISLDEQVEVSFNINETIKTIELDPSIDYEHYAKYFFSDNFKLQKPFFEYVISLAKGIYIVSPDETEIITLKAEPNKKYRLISLQTHSQFIIDVNENTSDVPQVIDADILSGGFSPEHITVDGGELKIYLHNLTKAKLVVSSIEMRVEEFEKVHEQYPHIIQPFLTGKMLLNNQSFRELFRIQSLSSDLKLSLKSLTIMFTDLKGSTEMYDKVGDYKAYNLVQQHFEILTDSVRKYSGAIVKTMGDAIMATFSNPNDAVLSAIDMMTRVEAMNKHEQVENKIGLKIGINEGNALAVNADDRLDYFGQSVNIAARVQALAQSDEIWVTQQVLNSDKVNLSLEDNDYQMEKNSALLKGVGSPVIVYKCSKELAIV